MRRDKRGKMTPDELKQATSDLAAIDAAIDQVLEGLAPEAELFRALAGNPIEGRQYTREELIALHGREKVEFAIHKALTLAAAVLGRHRMSRIIHNQALAEE